MNTAFIWGHPSVRTDKKNVGGNSEREMKKKGQKVLKSLTIEESETEGVQEG